ncbi:phosphotransferase [Gordonia sp. CPCC 206044]|uniref:phosphotransferase n=1 Tax=Gordonia sp. CPCC 206044 TaxID=3140793 RepID=UPI003AF39B42
MTTTDPNRTSIPTSPEEITAGYLTGLLRSAGHDVVVESVDTTPVGSGQMAGSYRLTLSYREPTDLPPTMVAKVAIGDRTRREFASGVYRTETLFYDRLAPTLAVPRPACHATAISPDSTECILLLEDMTPAVQGDQITGCSPAQAQSVAVAAAGLHGPRWCDDSMFEVPGLALPTHEDRELMESVLGPMADAYRARFELDAREAATIDWLVREAGDWIERTPTRFALIHGDLRIDNVLFGADDVVTIVDWQTISPGHPLRDIAFLLSTSLTVDDRRRHEQDIVAAYHRALLDHGVSGYTVEQCWHDYIDSLIQAPLIVVFGCAAAMATERGDHMFATMLSRCSTAVEDLNPGALR